MILLYAPLLPLTEQPGYLPAAGVTLLILLAAGAKCMSLMRRTATSRICVAALLAAVLALVVAVALHVLALSTPAWPGPTAALGMVAVAVLGLSAFVLGVVGLATYEKKRHKQGIGQALTGMGLGLLTTLVAFVLLVAKVMESEAARTTLVNVTDPSAGYATHLDTRMWKAWRDHEQSLADFTARRTHEVVMVVPLELGEAAPDLETMTSAILRRWNVHYPAEDGQWTSKPWACPWGGGLEVTGRRETDGTTFDYIFRVAVTGNFVQVHGGWVTVPVGDLAVLRRALDAITLTPPRPPVPVISAAKARQFGLMCNDLGRVFYEQEDHARAAHWFTRAATWDKTDGIFVTNAANAFRKAGRFKEGLEFLNARIASFPKNADAHVHHAHLLSETGDAEAGQAAFLRAVHGGLKDDDEALAWLQHLNGREHYALAEKAAEAWMRKHRSATSRRWHAQTVDYAGDGKRALVLLEELAKELPDDRRVAYDLGELLNRAGEHARAAEVAEKLLADGKKAPRALMILGWSQMGRKWHREAKQTFEQVAAM